MGRRYWTPRQVRTRARTLLGTLLGADRVSRRPPPMHGLVADSGTDARRGGVFVGIEEGTMSPIDGRMAASPVTDYPSTMVLEVTLVTSLAAADPGADQYDEHLDNIARIQGMLADFRDDAGERLPISDIRYRTEWQEAHGRFLVTTFKASVITRTIIVVP